jgi:hypothetical protein
MCRIDVSLGDNSPADESIVHAIAEIVSCGPTRVAQARRSTAHCAPSTHRARSRRSRSSPQLRSSPSAHAALMRTPHGRVPPRCCAGGTRDARLTD